MGILSLVPAAKVGHIGMYRDEETLQPVEYLVKLPEDIDQRQIFVVDPMLATGGSAILAVDSLKKRGASNIKFVCLVSAPEGVKALQEAHPDVEIFTAALDERFERNMGYIVPGLGRCWRPLVRYKIRSKRRLTWKEVPVTKGG